MPLNKVQNLFGSDHTFRGLSRIFERGGGQGGPISLGSLKKKGHQILKGGSNGLIGGSSTYSLPRMTNLAYLDAKE